MEDIISKELPDMDKCLDLMEDLKEKSISGEEALERVDDLLAPMKDQCRYDYLRYRAMLLAMVLNITLEF